MKKFALFFMAVLVIFITSGCVKYSYNIDIDDKGNINYTEILALQEKLLKDFVPSQEYLDSLFQAQKEPYEKEGFKVDEYSQDGYKGLNITKSFKQDTFKLPAGFTKNSDSVIGLEDSLLGMKKTYKINWQFSADEKNKANPLMQQSGGANTTEVKTSEVLNDEDIVSNESSTNPTTGAVKEKFKYKDGSTRVVLTDSKTEITREKYVYSNGYIRLVEVNHKTGWVRDVTKNKDGNVMMDITMPIPNMDLVIKIPAKKADKHNATKVINGNEYYWNFFNTEDKPTNIVLEYSLYDFSLAGIFVSIIVLLLVLGIAWKKLTE